MVERQYNPMQKAVVLRWESLWIEINELLRKPFLAPIEIIHLKKLEAEYKDLDLQVTCINARIDRKLGQ